jgi:hypothetical protein
LRIPAGPRRKTKCVETCEASWNRLWTVPPRQDILDCGNGHVAEPIAEVIVMEKDSKDIVEIEGSK